MSNSHIELNTVAPLVHSYRKWYPVVALLGQKRMSLLVVRSEHLTIVTCDDTVSGSCFCIAGNLKCTSFPFQRAGISTSWFFGLRIWQLSFAATLFRKLFRHMLEPEAKTLLLVFLTERDAGLTSKVVAQRLLVSCLRTDCKDLVKQFPITCGDAVWKSSFSLVSISEPLSKL